MFATYASTAAVSPWAFGDDREPECRPEAPGWRIRRSGIQWCFPLFAGVWLLAEYVDYSGLAGALWAFLPRALLWTASMAMLFVRHRRVRAESRGFDTVDLHCRLAGAGLAAAACLWAVAAALLGGAEVLDFLRKALGLVLLSQAVATAALLVWLPRMPLYGSIRAAVMLGFFVGALFLCPGPAGLLIAVAMALAGLTGRAVEGCGRAVRCVSSGRGVAVGEAELLAALGALNSVMSRAGRWGYQGRQERT